MSISEIAEALERAQRQGADKNRPEGSRYALCGAPHNAVYAESIVMRSCGLELQSWRAWQACDTSHNLGLSAEGARRHFVAALAGPRKRASRSALRNRTRRALHGRTLSPCSFHSSCGREYPSAANPCIMPSPESLMCAPRCRSSVSLHIIIVSEYYVVFSDTQLQTMARDLRLASADRPDVETFGVQKQ